ncbi:LysR substrate-binding domain-containing protein [Franconibacter helveticus 513]|uniref:LysR substrate-binding domain-containing protein n=1 Tax=Franconibacter helveticus TaxID=357240 RepID=UPI0004274887|nr:LysR substrate-binding domain-containing protein [Franconibacter helveticus]
MHLRQLSNFVVVAQELHMHRAAERLNMAQPALSQQIKSLEERLGVTLFSRANRRLTLTAAGDAFLQKTRVALAMIDQAVLEAQRTARGEQGVLNLGYVSSAMFNDRLPAMLRQLRARWPDIQVSLTSGDVQTLCDAVQSYRIDVAILRAPLATLADALAVHPLLREKTRLALYSQHPLANAASLNLASLKNESWISLRDPGGVGLEHHFQHACKQAGFTPQIAQYASDVSTLVSLVAAGLGVALVPASADAMRLENVVYLDVLDRLEESELCMVYHPLIRSEVVKKSIALLRNAAVNA